jgi:sucrose-6-phosphate hydrolase SacC (GH32 family)
MRRHLVALAILTGALLFQSTPAAALVKFDFEQKFFNEPGEEVLDHYLLEQDGVYHLFYLRGNPAINIGHATSTDLKHWNYEPPVLSPGTTWDTKLWAPHLFRHPAGIWTMFFTGVNAKNSQQTGVAYSNDLYNWGKYPDPLYHPDPVWAEWSTTQFSHGRDPHVIEHDGTYYLFNTAKTWTNQGAVACAVSQDLFNWTDIGPIYVHYTWHVMESIFVMERNNRFHMFFTEETVNGTSHMSSDSLLSGWDVIANRRIIDTGHAPQVSVMSDGTEIFSRHQIYSDNRGLQLYTLRFDTLGWVGEIPYPKKPWPLAADWTSNGTAFVYQPTYLNNPYARFEDVEPTYQGNCWIGTKEKYTGPNGYGTPGSVLGDGAVGTMQSKTFSITGYSMTLLVGGTQDSTSCYVALVDADTGEILARETGRGVEEMDQRVWDLYPYVGRSAFIRMVDQSENGHINADYIVESGDPVTAFTGNGRTTKKPKRIVLTGANTAVRGLSNSPNPFNPTTTISFELTRPAHATVQIYDVGGARIRSLVSRDLSAGVHQSRWDGTDDQGRPVASGIYFYRLAVDGDIVATRKMTLLK